MPTSKQKKALAVAALLLLFAAAKTAALLWWQKQQPEAAHTACDVRKGCTLPNGAQITFGGRIRVNEPFHVAVRNVPPQTAEVSASFSMRDMDMGFNRYKLQRQADGSWAAQIRLPVCTQNRRDYLADIYIGGEVFRIPFAAE